MDIVLNPQASEPIYTQIYYQISRQIINGSLEAGTKLPGIRQVANDLRISVIPVKMAWEELDKNGFIKTVSGSGTFVNNLHANELKSRLNEKAETLVLKTCKEAKESGISAETLIQLIKKLY